jgi:hypothetical protein
MSLQGQKPSKDILGMVIGNKSADGRRANADCNGSGEYYEKSDPKRFERWDRGATALLFLQL